MPLTFPSSPNPSEVYSFGNKTWQYNGSAWVLISSGDINNTPIGNVTPSTGVFTALTSTGNTSLGNISGNLLPASNVTYDLGSSSQSWNDLYLANSTIYLGQAQISSTANQLQLPANSTVNGLTLVYGPMITSISYPDGASAASPSGGQTVTLYGSNFQSGCTVFVADSAVSVTTFIGSTEIQFVTPAQSAGTYTINVLNPDGGVGYVLPGLLYQVGPIWTTASGNIGAPYELNSFSTTVTATSNSLPITYSLAAGNTLPANLTLTSANGYLSATTVPVTNNDTTYNFNIVATDAAVLAAARQFSVTYKVDVVTWSSPANNSTYTSYLNIPISPITLSATSAAGRSISYTINSGSLPSNVTLSGSTITGSGNVLQASTPVVFTATSAVTNRSADRTINFEVINDTITWNSPAANTTFSAYEGQAFSNVTLSATSAASQAVSYSLFSGALPTGLTLSGNTISGSSTGVGNAASTYRATAAVTGATGDRTLYFNVLQDVVTWSSPANAATYTAYETQAFANVSLVATSASGNSITYSATGLPSGVTVVGSTITGTSNTPGSYTAIVKATSAANVGGFAFANLTQYFNVVQDTVTWSSPAEGASYTYQASFSISPISLSASAARPGQTIAYSVASGSLPAGLSISGSQIVGTPTTQQSNTSVSMRATASTTGRYADRTLYFTITPPPARNLTAAGGQDSGGTSSGTIYYFSSIGSGPVASFGSLTQNRSYLASCASTTRAIFAGGQNGSSSGTRYATIDYVTIATTGNASGFGSLSVTRSEVTGANSDTRGVFAGGWTGSASSTIDYVTIASTGNASSFGSLSPAKTTVGSTSSPTRMLMGGGFTSANVSDIQYITIASTSNSSTFGNLVAAVRAMQAGGSQTRAVFFGGYGTSNWNYNIEYVEIATTGNSTSFASTTTYATYFQSTSSNQTAGLIYVGINADVFKYSISSGAYSGVFGTIPDTTKYYYSGIGSANGGLSL